MAKFYDSERQKYYYELDYACQKCDWSGTGRQVNESTRLYDGYNIYCPECGEKIEWIDDNVPRQKILEYRSAKEKQRVADRVAEIRAVAANEAKGRCQFPDIDWEYIVIALVEEKSDVPGCWGDIVLYWADVEIWRQNRNFEYYTTYLWLGERLREKYGKRLEDFEAEYTWALCGNCISAFNQVRTFRKSLGKYPHISVSDEWFDFSRKSGEFSRQTATCWKALDLARKRHQGQTRDDGSHYFGHIEGVIEIIRDLGGLDDEYRWMLTDYIITIAALHDILEDTDTTEKELYDLLCNQPIDDDIQAMLKTPFCKNESEARAFYDKINNRKARDIVAEVKLLTHKKEDSFEVYINRIFDNNSIKRENQPYAYDGKAFGQVNGAAVVKLADRLHNLSELHLCGRREKIERYIKETKDYIMSWRGKVGGYNRLFEKIEDVLVKIPEKAERYEDMWRLAKEMVAKIKIEDRASGEYCSYSVITNKEDLENMARGLQMLMIRDVDKYSNLPGYTTAKERTISVQAENGLIYEIYALKASRSGGSEGEYTDELRIVCKAMDINTSLYHEVEYIR